MSDEVGSAGPGPASVTATSFNYPLGIVLAVTGSLTLSTGGLLLRTIEEASGWQVLVYRSGSFILTLLLVIALRNRGRLIEPFRAIGPSGLLIAVLLGCGFPAYVFALLNTSVANAMFILASAPVFSAVLGRFLLGEILRPLTWVLIFIAVAGIGVMAASDLTAERLWGNLFAAIAAFTFALSVVLFRRAKGRDMLPATCLAGVVSLLMSLPLAGSLAISNHDLIVSLILGSFQVGIGFVCYTYAPRYILAAEVTLLALLETILAPLWVWLAFNEVPTTATLAGGALVLFCVIVFTVSALVEQRAKHG